MQAIRGLINRSTARIVISATFLTLVLGGLFEVVYAKGPVSATISGPRIEEPVELVEGTDPALVTRLMEQTGFWYATGDLPRRLAEAPDGLGSPYTLTWINSGPPGKSVEERTIRQMLYVDADGRLVIHTPAQEGLEGWGGDVTGWFAAPEGLRETLAELGAPIEASKANQALAGIVGSRDGLWYLAAVVLALVLVLGVRTRARLAQASHLG